MRLIQLIIILLIFMGTAHTQIIKCVDLKSKQISYTDSACPVTNEATLIESKHSESYYASEEAKAQDAKALISQRQQRESQATHLLSGDKQQETSNSAHLSDNSGSYECMIAKQALGVAQTNFKPNQETIALKRQEAEVTCLGRDAHVQLKQAREKRKQEEFNISAQHAPITVFITTCDQGGCWAGDGNRYNAQGTSFLSPNGRTCQKLGNALQCE